MAKQDLTQALSGVIQDKKENNLNAPKPIKKEPKPTPKKVETTRLDDEIVGSVRDESVLNYALRLPIDFYKALKLYRRTGFREDYCYPQAYLLQKK